MVRSVGLDVDQPQEIARVSPGRETVRGDGAWVVPGPPLLELDADALLVERDIALDSADLVEGPAVRPHQVLLGDVTGRERPVIGLALERTDAVVLGGHEEVPPDVVLGEVEPVDVLRLLDAQARVALGEEQVAVPDPSRRRARHEIDPIVGVATPRRLDLGHPLVRHSAHPVVRAASYRCAMSVRIGIVSDTHMPGSMRRLWDEIATVFAGVDLILHAGDIVLPMVLEQLEELAPVLAARGNNDVGWDDHRLAEIQWLEIEGYRIVMVHDMEPEDEPIDVLRRKYLNGVHADVMVTGHTHFERIAWRDEVLQVNPGSSVHPHLWSTRPGSVAVLDVGPRSLRARIVRLGEHDGLRNPAVGYEFDGTTVRRIE